MSSVLITTHKLPKVWKKEHVISLKEPRKDPGERSIPKNYRPIPLLRHTPTTSQVLNLTQYIEDGFEEAEVAGVVFVDSAAYDTVNPRCLLYKILELTKDITTRNNRKYAREQVLLCWTGQ